MSGLAVIYRPQNDSDIDRMIGRIAHRGPAITGRFTGGEVQMVQNYLPADIGGASEEIPDIAPDRIPVGDRSGGPLRLCYDGQIGNWPALAAEHGVPDGPFREERLILALYNRYGTGVCDRLTDAIFAFVLWDGGNLMAARDLLGIKTLFCGRKDGALGFASELKSICAAFEDVWEFPAGHRMDARAETVRFAALPESPPDPADAPLDDRVATVRDIIERSVRNRVDFSRPTASLLSGGIDSSVVAALAGRHYTARFGRTERLPTFALGVGESDDIRNARRVAHHIGSDHHERIVDLDDVLAVLPDVVYFLESFDPSLVRSAVSNFLISEYARRKGIEVLLSGEGGDEVFCGYLYLKEVPAETLFRRQMECLGLLHNNAALRLDRMNHCHSLRVVAPLISGELLAYAMGLPPETKLMPTDETFIEKWILRKAFEERLPTTIVWRTKQEFSQGSGAASVLPDHFESTVSDADFSAARSAFPFLRSKEEYRYFTLFTDHFGTGSAVDTVGRWISV